MAFGPFRLTPSRRMLTRNGEPVSLGGRALDVLIHFATRPGVVVDKETLINAVWPGRTVEDNNLTVQIAALRRVLADGQDKVPVIRTIARRGYIFVADVKRASPPDAMPSDRPPSVVSSRIPQAATSFIGRVEERAEIIRHLEKSRLVTITGMGGLGKTRVALQLASELTSNYLDGVWFIDLSAVTDLERVAETVTMALDVGSGERPAVERLTAFLAHRRGLLVLDNCEHVINAIAELANAVRAACPSVTILAASRESLSLPGEIVVSLRPLPFPTDVAGLDAATALHHDAVRLFVDRAAALVPDFVLDDETAPAVARICANLDGIALAIEMAVPRLRVLTPAALADRLSERFRLLVSSDRAASPRHRTLRAMIDWSYDLLTDAERSLLRRLSLFAGGADLTAIVAVSAGSEASEWDLLRHLSSLAGKSLLSVDVTGARRRFRLLETIRQYANEKLTECGETDGYRRHAEFFATLFETAEAEWPITKTTEWLKSYADEVDNLRAALKWAFGADGDPALGLRLVAASYPLWWDLPQMPVAEGRNWFDLAASLMTSETPAAVAARIWLGVSWKDMRLNDQASFPAARRAVELFRQAEEPLGLGGALWRLGTTMFAGTNAGQTRRFCVEAEQMLRPLGPSKWLVMNLIRIADIDLFEGQLTAALPWYEEAMVMADLLDHWYGRLVCTTNMSELLFELGQRERALDLLQRLRRDLSPRRCPPLLAPLVAHLLIAGRTREMLDTAYDAAVLAGIIGLAAPLGWIAETLALYLAESGDIQASARFAGYARSIHPATTIRVGGRLVVQRRLEEALATALSTSQRLRLTTEGAGWSGIQAAEQARLICGP